MDVQATIAWNLQDRLRQYQAIGCDHHQLGVQFGYRSLAFFRLQGAWLHYLQAVLQCQLFYRTGGEVHAASRRAVRLAKHRNNLVFLYQRGQCFGCELRCACKNDLHVLILESFAALLFELGADPGLLEMRQMLDEYASLQMIHLVLDAHRQQAFCF